MPTKLHLAPEPPTSLAALRIVVPALILAGPELREGVRVAGFDPSLWVAPEGLGWFVRSVPISHEAAVGVEVVAAFAALLAIVGIAARPALAVLTLSAGYLFALANLTGWVWHDVHLLWLSALLAVSPCDHALAYDAPSPERPPSTLYAWPLLFVRLLLGAVYFFPGVHKLARSGFAWALSDNLRNQLYWKWFENGVLPTLRLDAYPHLLEMGALFVLLFELAAPVLFLVRRTRFWGAVLGVAFHLLAQAILLIPFLSLWACYVALVDVRPLLARLGRRAQGGSPDESERPSSWPVEVVGAVLVCGVVVQGIRGQMQAFPFACYPTFEWRADTEIPDLRLVAEWPDGHTLDVPHARDSGGYRSQREWGTIWSLARLGGVVASGPDTEARLRTYYRAVTADEPLRGLTLGADRVRVLIVYRSVIPEDRDRPPLRETLLAEIPL